MSYGRQPPPPFGRTVRQGRRPALVFDRGRPPSCLSRGRGYHARAALDRRPAGAMTPTVHSSKSESAFPEGATFGSKGRCGPRILQYLRRRGRRNCCRPDGRRHRLRPWRRAPEQDHAERGEVDQSNFNDYEPLASTTGRKSRCTSSPPPRLRQASESRACRHSRQQFRTLCLPRPASACARCPSPTRRSEVRAGGRAGFPRVTGPSGSEPRAVHEVTQPVRIGSAGR
jgi:hypothetical protein